MQALKCKQHHRGPKASCAHIGIINLCAAVLVQAILVMENSLTLVEPLTILLCKVGICHKTQNVITFVQ